MRTKRGVEWDDEFVAFVRDAQPRLCRVAYLVCGNWHLAEDTETEILECRHGVRQRHRSGELIDLEPQLVGRIGRVAV